MKHSPSLFLIVALAIVASALGASLAIHGTQAESAKKGGMYYQPVLGVTATDHGGTLTTGGTAQVAIPANLARKGGYIQNPVDATEDLYVSTTGTAPSASGAGANADLGPGERFELVQGNVVDTGAVSVNAVTSAHKFQAVELH